MKKFYLFFLFSIICATASAQLVLNEVLMDPATDAGANMPGDANRDGVRSFDNDEFIEFVNTSGSALDITGYKIYDITNFALLPGTDDPRHVVGDTDGDDMADVTISIPAGGIYVVFGGGDLTTIKAALPTVTFEQCTTLSLTGNGEVITVTDASGTVLITFDDDDIGFADGRLDGGVAETFNISAEANQSLTRFPASTGDFGYHLGLNGQYQSPGELPNLPSGNDLIINEIFASPGTTTGDANGDGSGGADNEFLEIVNTTDATIDITGYKFFDRTNLFSGGTAAIFSGTPRHIVGDDNNDGTAETTVTIPGGGVYVVFAAGTPTGTFGGAVVETSSTGSLSLTDEGDFMIIADASDNYVNSFGSNSVVDTWNSFESYTRDPDLTGGFVKHRDVTDVTTRFSPGTKSDGSSLLINKFNKASSNWNDVANWSLGNIPTATDNVEIPSGNTVNIDLDNSTTNNLDVIGTLNINTTESLTVSGNLNNTGTFSIDSGGSLIVSGTSAGNVTYNRELTFEAGDLKGWHTIGSPVIGQVYNNTYANTNGLATSTTDVTKRGIGTYDIPNNAWAYLTTADANAGTFTSGVGYTMKRASTGDVAFTGTLNTNNAGVDVGLLITGDRFNPLANPYTSYVNSATFLTNESAISETQTLWVWNQGLGTNGEYEVKTVGLAMVIAPGQGFFVKANAAGGTFNFTEGNQNHNGGTDSFQKSAGKTEVNLWITDGAIKNYSKIHYLENSTTGFDVGYEGEMFNVASPFAVYSHLITDNNGKNYQIQSLPKSDYENMIIPIGLNAAAGKEITFTTEALNLPTGLKVFLEDKLTNSFTRLDEANSNYKVTLTDKSEGTGRFYIHTKASSVLSTEIFDLESVSIYKTSNSNLKVAGLSQGKASIKLFNILGKQVLNTSFSANGNNDISLPKLATGIYIVQLETENGNINKKITLE
jgi:hypothetical protein